MTIDIDDAGDEPTAPNDAPKFDAGKFDAPKFDAGKPEALKSDAPKSETPKSETPNSEAGPEPRSEAAKPETKSEAASVAAATKTDAPEAKADAGQTAAPKVDVAKIDALKVEAPKADSPKIEPPKIEPPRIEPPKIEPPKIDSPSIDPPKIDSPKPEAPAPAVEPTSAARRRAPLQSAPSPQAPPAPPPKKKKRRDGTLSALSGFLSFMLVALVAGAFGVIAVMHKLKEPGPLGAEKIVYIPPRSDIPEIIAQLEREGVIDSPALMNFALFAENARGKLKQGEYLFKKNASLREVMDEMIAGRQVLHSVTIPEGLTSEQIIQRLKEMDILAGEVVDMPKEGALLPETYKVPRGFPRPRLLNKMQEDQRKLLNAIWAKRARDLPLKTPYELVTLASIVEKETGKSEERPRVAAVFVNRLRKNMRLQSDPTIVYGLVGGKASLGRGILRSEIEKWTPYNTYAVDGLPPGPIANPGRAALEAAANPAQTRDLYFVADGTGGHVFSESLDQHSRNVQQWRRIEKDQKDKSDPAVDRAVPATVPPPAPKSDKRGAAPIGRLVDLAARHENYPPGRAMAEDNGATHRLGQYGPGGAAFWLGGYEDPTAAAGAQFAALRPARAFFTEGAAQRRGAGANFDPDMLAAAPAPSSGEGEDALAAAPEMARESADGRALPEDGAGDIAAYPVSAARRADQKARAARLGLATGSDQLPRDTLGARATPEEAAAPSPAPAYAAAPEAGRAGRPRAFDASEGTTLDPLRDRSWDLTSAKTVPSATNLR